MQTETTNAVFDPAEHVFYSGERVYLRIGPQQGTVGRFITYRPDSKWAEIQEETRNKAGLHPVAWLRHCPEGELAWNDLLRD